MMNQQNKEEIQQKNANTCRDRNKIIQSNKKKSEDKTQTICIVFIKIRYRK